MLQSTVGDFLINSRDGRVLGIELKTERREHTGNLFLETWSNKSRGRRGWLYTLDADFLWYLFLDTKNHYVISFPKLKQWALADGHLTRFPERAQKKYTQMNDAYGRCVPIRVIEREVGFVKLNNTISTQ